MKLFPGHYWAEPVAHKNAPYDSDTSPTQLRIMLTLNADQLDHYLVTLRVPQTGPCWIGATAYLMMMLLAKNKVHAAHN
jgi:hypothetical protein